MRGRPSVIGVIGGGAAGALSAIHLQRDVPDSARVIVFEPRAQLGRGVAYSTTDARHLLNVRADRLSAFPEYPDHFTSWARRRTAFRGEQFLPRALYGQYLSELLQPVAHVQNRVMNVVPTSEGATVGLDDGSSVNLDRVVLALGPPAPVWPEPLRALDGHPRLISDPWRDGALAAADPDAAVLLVGTGLTAIDTVLSLRAAGHRRIVAISRHGLLPNSHGPHSIRAPMPLPAPSSARALVRWLRENCAEQPEWRMVVDGIRPHTDAVWTSLPHADRARFLRHVYRYWEVVRHRVAPEIATQIRAIQDADELTIEAGRITGARVTRDSVEVTMRDRRISVGSVVNCAGPPLDVRRSVDPLVRWLLDSRIARPGPLNLGFDTDDQGRLPGLDDRFWVVGALRQGRIWETTAIPEIRAQAVALTHERRRSGVEAVA